MKLTGPRITNFNHICRAAVRLRPRAAGFMARVFLFLCALAASSTAPAQNIQYSQGSVGSSLNNALQIPLGAYPGRGGASLPVTLYYSSDLWRIKYRGTIYNSQQASLSEPMADVKYAEYSKSGWTSSLNVPVLEWPPANEVYDYLGKSVCLDCGPNPLSPTNYWKVPRLTVHMPDGTVHEMRRGDDQPYTGAVNNTGVYYAVDGSRLRYDTATATLFLSDGSRYVLGATTVQFFDRNGNRLDYNQSTRQWTDTLGRVISAPPLSTAAYTLPGVGGTDVTYTFRWGSLGTALEPIPGTTEVPALQYAAACYFSTATGRPQGVGGASLFHNNISVNDEGLDVTEYVIGSNLPFNPSVLKELVLPNQLSYKFQYNVYGEITKITYPTGGVEWLKYDQVQTVNSLTAPYDQVSRGVVERCVSPTGQEADKDCWQYGVAYDGNTQTYKRWTLNPDQTYSESYLFKTVTAAKFGYEDPRNGMPYEERFYQTHQMQGDTPQGVTMLRRKLIGSTYSSRNVTVNYYNITTTAPAMRNPRVTKEVGLILDTGGDALAKTLTYSYGNTTASGAVTTQHEFTTGLDRVSSTESHFIEGIPALTAQSGGINDISPDAGPIASTAVTTYLDDEDYRGRNILGLATSVVLKDANGQPVSKTVTGYDEAALQTYTDLSSDPQWSDPQTTARGNVTTVRRYLNASANVPLGSECLAGECLDTHAYFDQVGNVWKTSDTRGNESVVVYPSEYKHAYPTTTSSADPDGSDTGATALTTTTDYDFDTGLVLSTTDANGQTTEFKYADDSGVVDPMNRLLKVIRPDEGWTSYYYSDTPGQPLYVRTTTSLDATRSTESYQFVDGLGRPSRTFASEGGTPVTYLTADTQYDSMGRTEKASNPYRTSSLTDPVNPSNKWTTNAYDALSRVKTVTLPDNTAVQTTYQGVYTTVTDQAGKKRRQKTDALGRVVRVDEPDAAGNIGTNDAPTQPTSYDYDALGNLVHITQGAGQYVQHRYFKYDALSRLTYEKQVEQAGAFAVSDPVTGNGSWSRKLVYDELIGTTSYKGLLTSHYDARNVRTRYTYDSLNRVKQVTYTDGTPTVTNYYDQAQAGYFNKGQLTEVKTAAVSAAGIAAAIPATSQAYDYDLMGRVKSHKQTVGTNAYSTSYAYGLGGQLESETYPSGRVVRHSYDGAGRLAGVDNGAGSPYASNFVYGPKGALTSLTLGNGTVQTFDYNDRLQLTTTSLVKDGAALQRYDYKYGQINVSTGALDEAKNNGQVARIEGFIGTAKQWQQRFGYDSLGRLSQAAEYQGATTTRSYLISYDYDSFGNRYQFASENPSTTNPLEHVAVEDSQIDKLTNHFIASTGVTYDAAGNVTTDNKFTLRQYSYDANSRQRTVSADASAANAYTSVYDGAGQRVATVFGGQTSVMVYDAFGKLVAEYGQPVTGSGIQYVFADHQGSTRVVTNGTGAVVSRHDYQPFGGEIYAGVGMRAEAQLYGQADLVRQKHAAMERDDGSSLSHTLWRKQDYLSGRWTSTDPYGGSMTISDPQSFNRYTYVNNDPVNQTDSLGLMTDASQGYSGFEGWGGGVNPNGNHFGGPGILAKAMLRHDYATNNDFHGGNYSDPTPYDDNREGGAQSANAYVRDPETGELVPAGSVVYSGDPSTSQSTDPDIPLDRKKIRQELRECLILAREARIQRRQNSPYRSITQGFGIFQNPFRTGIAAGIGGYVSWRLALGTVFGLGVGALINEASTDLVIAGENFYHNFKLDAGNLNTDIQAFNACYDRAEAKYNIKLIRDTYGYFYKTPSPYRRGLD